MKWTLVSSNYDAETGISKVIINTELGTFEGTSKLHDEDKDIQSKYTGCRYAEMRAAAKYLKRKIKNQKIKVDTLKNLISNLERLADYDKDVLEARFVRKNYFLELSKYNAMKTMLVKLEETILQNMENYRKEYENFQNKITKKESTTEE